MRRKQGWFDLVRNSNLNFAPKRSMAVLEKCNGRLKSYKDEICWGLVIDVTKNYSKK